MLALLSMAMRTARFFAMPRGEWSNGDAVLLLAAREMQSRGALANATVVATTMSNMGLELALKRSGIQMLRANVGDKYVLEEMQRVGATLGGEQSGHILFRDGDATTGDGLLTALRVLEIMVRTGKPLADLVSDLKVFPQTIRNVRVRQENSLRADSRGASGDCGGRAGTRRQWPCGRALLRHRSAGARDD